MKKGFPSLSEAEMLQQITKWTIRPRVLSGIIKGSKSHGCLKKPVTVIAADDSDHKLSSLMDDLYRTYRLDPTTENGMCILPVRDTLKHHQGSEFVIYSTPEGVVKGFFMSFLVEYSDASCPVPEMTFVWVVPRFRRQGVFSQMYRDLELRRGPFRVDSPNDACKIALASLGYSDERVRRFFTEAKSA